MFALSWNSGAARGSSAVQKHNAVPRTWAVAFPGRHATTRANEGRWEAWVFTPISLEECDCLDGAAIY